MCTETHIYHVMQPLLPSPVREDAARQAMQIIDTELFRALCEPSRVAILAELIRKGRSDVNAVAEGLPQDRSVISRHLQILADCGVVVASREGRHVFYEIDGPETCARLQAVVDALRALSPLCCPALR